MRLLQLITVFIIKHEIKVSRVIRTVIISGVIFILALVNLQMSQATVLVCNPCDWMTRAIQIKNDPITLDLCMRELFSFNSQAAALLFEHSTIDSLENAELVINFKLNEGTFYIHVGLEGIEGIHLSLQPRYPPSGL